VYVCVDVHSIPSSDELLDLQQTQQLFKSNLFKLQVPANFPHDWSSIHSWWSSQLIFCCIMCVHFWKIQIKELLAAVSYKPEQLSRVDNLLHVLKATLDTLPTSNVTISNGESVLGVPIRLVHDSTSDDKSSASTAAASKSKKKGTAAGAGGFSAEQLSCTITTPSRVDVVGSYLLRTVTKPLVNVDIAITIPKVICLA
jgi:hypothetical protein